MSTYTREAAQLKDQAGNFVLGLLRENHAFIAGGAITSIFCSAKINDFDIFFRDQKSLALAMEKAIRDDKTIETDSALSFVLDGKRIQIVKVVLGTPKTVINTFDFTVCQGAYSLTEGFVFAPDFLHHLAQRRLVFNIKSPYPICALYRTKKYIRRGFSLSGIEAIKLGLAIQNLNIPNYAILRKQLQGIDTLFLKDLTDSLRGKAEKTYDLNEFLASLDEYMDKLDRIVGMEEYE